MVEPSENLYMAQFVANPEEIDEDAPALRPEDVGEDPDHPSATHGDFHARDPKLMREITNRQVIGKEEEGRQMDERPGWFKRLLGGDDG